MGIFCSIPHQRQQFDGRFPQHPYSEQNAMTEVRSCTTSAFEKKIRFKLDEYSTECRNASF
eukprot:scaffold8070_cov117-Cylindrotheca_fusiformis.AAC.6